MPADLIKRGLVTAAFKVEAENLKYPKFEKPTSSSSQLSSEPGSADPSAEPGDFFRLWIWDPPAANAAESNENGKNSAEGKENTLLLPLGADFRFDLQFGRRVMAKLMQLERRINWKDDVQSQEEEEADAAAFKETYKEFDFTLEE